MNSRAYHAVQKATSDDHEQTTVEPGPFPTEALSNVQQAIVAETAAVHQIDQALPGMAAVATIAGTIGKGHVVHGAVNGKDTPLNLYVLAGAPKSYGKGAASSITRPLIDASTELAENFRQNIRPDLIAEQRTLEARHKVIVQMLAKDGTGAGDPMTATEKHDRKDELTMMQKRMDDIAVLVKQLPSFWIGSATTPALVDCLIRNDETIFSYSPEAGELVRVALGKFTKNDAADFDLLLSGYTVEPYRETRVGRGDNLLTPCISTLWFCQPFLLRELAGNDEAAERGLTARALSFVCEHADIPEDDGVHRQVSDQARDRWAALVKDILTTRPTEPTIIQCSTQAREIFRQFHNESVRLRNGDFRDIQGELGRWRENAVRLAGGLCVADHYAVHDGDGITLTADHAERGVKLARWACFSTLSMMQAGRESRRLTRAKSLVRLVSESGGKVTLRDLRRSHGYDTEEVNQLATAYPLLLQVAKIVPGAQGGRPSEVLTIPGKIAKGN
jgi:hypothetical protein